MATGRVELHQSVSNALQLPILIAVVAVAVLISEVARGPSAPVLFVCFGAMALDAWLAIYVLRRMRATLVVTPDAITFSRGPATAGSQVIRRSAASALTFRTARNGPLGSQYTGYVLKLRDTATDSEVFAGAFGRTRVRQACESQGWPFA